eukprot:1747947-Amphidinium_carterae.1
MPFQGNGAQEIQGTMFAEQCPNSNELHSERYIDLAALTAEEPPDCLMCSRKSTVNVGANIFSDKSFNGMQ